MRISKYLIGIWVAITIYTVFSLLGGPKGLSAYNYLLSERERQWENLDRLGLINEELEKTRNNLLFDQDTLLVHARQLGYGQDGERFVRIVGLGNTKNTLSNTGNIYIASMPDYIPDKNIKITAVCIALLIFAFLFMLEFIDSRSR